MEVIRGVIGTTKGHWLPELSHLSDDEIHTPWVTGRECSEYPGPCVDPERFAKKKGAPTKKRRARCGKVGRGWLEMCIFFWERK